ncbi:MAG: mechanosensitive ion channel family protein [Anaerorhabdus sp.]
MNDLVLVLEKILDFGRNIFINGLVFTLILFFVLIIFGKIIKKIIRKAIRIKLSKSGKQMISSYYFTEKVLIFLLDSIIVIVVLLQIRGFQQVGAAMLGASGVAALVIGLAAQESMSNVLGGFFLSFYRPFDVGDLIHLPDKNLTGRVIEIGFRHTEIETLMKSRVIVPNSLMNNSVVENKDKGSSNFCNLLYFGISYDSDVNKAIKIIQKHCMNHPDCIDVRSKKDKDNKAPVVPVLMTALKDFSVELRASVMSKDAAIGFAMSCDLRKKIKEDFDKKGITIPFPTNYIIQDENKKVIK